MVRVRGKRFDRLEEFHRAGIGCGDARVAYQPAAASPQQGGAGEAASHLLVGAEVEQLFEGDVLSGDVVPEIGNPGGMDRRVQWADLLAEIAAENPGAHLRHQLFIDHALVLDGQV